MCKENDRLNAFSYALEELVKIHKEKYGLSSIQEALKSFSNTRIMKLFYCLCLESIVIKNEIVSSIGLFELFGCFYAFPNGPVLRDIYYILDKVPGFKYEDGHFSKYEDGHISDMGVPDSYKILINDSVFKLFNNLGSGLFNDRNKLVELTHKLPLWRDAFLYKANKEMSIDPKDLKKEYDRYYSEIDIQRKK